MNAILHNLNPVYHSITQSFDRKTIVNQSKSFACMMHTQACAHKQRHTYTGWSDCNRAIANQDYSPIIHEGKPRCLDFIGWITHCMSVRHVSILHAWMALKYESFWKCMDFACFSLLHFDWSVTCYHDITELRAENINVFHQKYAIETQMEQIILENQRVCMNTFMYACRHVCMYICMYVCFHWSISLTACLLTIKTYQIHQYSVNGDASTIQPIIPPATIHAQVCIHAHIHTSIHTY